MPSFTVVVDFQRAEKVIAEVAKRALNPGPVLEQVPQIMRFGPGSLDQQIQAREFQGMETRAGWTEPAFAVGRPAPPQVTEGEQSMWDAVRGLGPGSLTEISGNSAAVGVDDNQIRIAAAARGNQIVSDTPYFGFVTGNFAERTAPAPMVAAKGVSPIRRRGIKGQGKHSDVTPHNFTSWNVTRALFWFLGFSYDYWPTESELRGGLMVPPKNLGPNPVMIGRIRDTWASYIMGTAAA